MIECRSGGWAGWIGIAVVVAVLGAAPGEARARGVLQRPDNLEPYAAGYGRQERARSNDPWVVFADREGVPLYADPPCTKRRGTARFMQRFFVGDERDDGRALLLVDAEVAELVGDYRVTKRIGWARTSDLLLCATAYRDPQTLIYAKAVVGSNYEVDESSDQGRTLSLGGAKLRFAPDPTAPGEREIRLQDFTYVYKTVVVEEQQWFLVARAKYFYPFRDVDVERLAVGWVSDSRTFRWNTRQALEPDPERSEGLNIYKNLVDAYRGGEKGLLFADTMDRAPWPPNRFRYPIDEEYIYAPGHFGPEQTFPIGRIQFLQRLVYWDGRGGRGELNPEETARMKQTAQAVARDLGALDLVVVVDATESMGPHLRKTADMVERVFRQFSEKTWKGVSAVRYGAVVYRDQAHGKRSQVETKPLTRRAGEVSDWLRQRRTPQPGVDRDFEEGLYLGVRTALRRVLRGADGIKVVVVIGDAGDNGRSGIPVDDLVEATDARTLLHAVHILYPTSNLAQRVANEKFAEDLRGLQQRIAAVREQRFRENDLPPQWVARTAEMTGFFEAPYGGDASATGDRVFAAVERSVELIREAGGQLERLNRGEAAGFVPSPLLISMLTGRYGKKVFRAMMANKVQVMLPGYVRFADREGRPVVRKVLLLDRNDLGDLIRTLDDIVGPGGQEVDTILRVWKQSVEKQVGKDENATLNDMVRRRLGILFPDRNKVLSMPISEINRLSRRQILDLVAECDDLRRRLSRMNNGDQWYKPGELEYTWIRQEDLP